MFRSVYLRVFALYLLLAIYWLRKVNAKVVLSGNNVTGRAYPSTDYYLRPETHYHYSGVALYWEFRYDPSKEVCTFTPVDTTDNDLQDIARTASDYTHFAIALNYPRSVYTECVDKNQMDEATRTFFEQLAKIGFPTVKLFLLLGHPGKIAYIVDDYIIHNDPNAFRKYIRSVPVTVAAVKPDKKIDLPETKVGNYTRFFYRVEQEDNGWNRIMLSPEKILYKWICYALLLLVLVYSVARTTRLITLRLLQFNLFTSAYIVAVIYAIFLLLHYIAPYNYAILDNATFIYSFLSRLPFDMVLWHWSIVGRNLFSRRSVLLFRLIITIDLLSNFFRFGFMIANISQPEDLDNRLQLYQDLITITSVAIPAISTAIFGGFSRIFSYALF
ncbi:hypothetical protein BDF22DRAFT_418546 [Syncephalis plumigaleata]|nr:hypothetical protein BDF22DRAFT_418546 [Syncephalis plumigaleata]